MTRVRSRLGTVASRCSSTGTEMLYGRLATRAVGGAGWWADSAACNAFASMRRASAVTTVSGASGCSFSTVRGSWAARRASISTAMTGCPASSSPSVSEPSPGPTSSTVAPAGSPAAATMRRTVFASCTKFWPSRLVGCTPSWSASSRTSAGPSNALTAGSSSVRGHEPEESEPDVLEPEWSGPSVRSAG